MVFLSTTHKYLLCRHSISECLLSMSSSQTAVSWWNISKYAIRCNKNDTPDQKKDRFHVALQSCPDFHYFSPMSPWLALLIFIQFVRVICPSGHWHSPAEAFSIALSSLINQAINTEDWSLDGRKTVTAVGKMARERGCYVLHAGC